MLSTCVDKKEKNQTFNLILPFLYINKINFMIKEFLIVSTFVLTLGQIITLQHQPLYKSANPITCAIHH